MCSLGVLECAMDDNEWFLSISTSTYAPHNQHKTHHFLPPAQMFQDATKYSAYDEKGIPTVGADGQPVSKAGRKKLEKEYDAQVKLYQKVRFLSNCFVVVLGLMGFSLALVCSFVCLLCLWRE